MSNLPLSFMDYVQFHERIWGDETYTNRPELQQILDADVVVFWQEIGPENMQNRRFHVTLHDKLDEVERHIAKAIQRTHNNEFPDERIHRIFKNGVRVNIKRIHVEFEEADSDETKLHEIPNIDT